MTFDPTPRPPKIGIIVPSSFEFKCLEQPYPGVVHVSGMGKVRAALEVAQMKLNGVDFILLTGFCGGLRGLSVGDQVEAASFIYEGDYDCRPLEMWPNTIQNVSGVLDPTKKVNFVCQDKMLTEDIYADTIPGEELATDMESFAFVAACRKFNIHYGVVKIVSDTCEKSAPHDFLEACEKYSKNLNILIHGYLAIITKDYWPLWHHWDNINRANLKDYI